MGHYRIIDNVSFGKCQVDIWKDALKEYKVIWIGLKAPLDILETREKERGNRIQGSARAQYFQDVIYDQEFDTNKNSLEMIVRTIKEHYDWPRIFEVEWQKNKKCLGDNCIAIHYVDL